MRGIAALAVVALHVQHFFGIRADLSGYLAVDFFFVLSGFVVALAYDAKLERGAFVTRFVRLRLTRFYPLYLAGLFLAGVAGVAIVVTRAWGLSWMDLAACLAFGVFFLPSPFNGTADRLYLNTPGWSLALEVLINVAYALCFRWLSTRVLLWLLAFGLAGLVGAALRFGDLNGGPNWPDGWVGLFRVLFSFSAGVLIYRHRRCLAGLRAMPSILLLGVLGLLLFLPVPADWRVPYDLAFAVVVSPALVAVGSMARGATMDGRFLGRLSYPLYALHYPLIAIVHGLALRGGWPLPATGAAYVACIVLMSWCAGLADERFRSWLKATLSQPTSTLSSHIRPRTKSGGQRLERSRR